MAVDVIARLKLAGSTLGPAMDRELADVERKVESSGRRMGGGLSAGMITGLQVGAAGIAAAVGAALTAAQASMQFAKDIQRTSDELRVGTQELQAYRAAARQLNIETDALDKGFGTLAGNVAKAVDGNQAAVKAFYDLNVAITDVNGQSRTTDAVFRDVIDRLHDIEDPAQRAAAASSVLGSEAEKLGGFARVGSAGVDELTNSADALNQTMSQENIDKLNEASVAVEGFYTRISVSIATQVAENKDNILALADGLVTFAERSRDALSAWGDYVMGLQSYGWGGLTLRAKNAVGQWTGWDAPPPGERDPVNGSPFGTFADVRRLAAPSAGAVTRPTARPTRARGGGGGGAGGPSAEERAAAQLARERARNEERLNQQIREGLQLQSDAQRIEAIRVRQGEDAAELARTEAEFLRQHPEAAAQTVEEFARLAELAPPLTAADRERLQLLMDQLATLKAQTLETVAQRQERDYLARKDAEVAATAEEMRRKAKEESDRQYQEMRDRGERTLSDLADFYEGIFTGNSGSIWRDFKAQGLRALAELAAQWTLSRLSGSAMGGFNIGGLFGGQGGGGSFFDALLGSGGSGGIGGIGRIFGGAGGAKSLVEGSAPASAPGFSGLGGNAGLIGIALAANSALNSLFGNDQRVGGPLLHMALGPILSMALAAKKGSATLGFSNGMLGVGSSRGNSQSRIAAARDGIGSVADTLTSIAEQLGGTITGAGSVSLGVRKKTYVVDPTGQGRTKGAGVLKFKSEEEAIQAAIRDALSDGVIGAISAASQRILASGQDLQTAIEKATLIESIPKALKARQDPVGAALDELNAKWEKIIAALKEGGASAEQMADAQKLYRLELEDTKASVAEASASLKGFLDSLNFGSNSPLSLRDQEAAARAALEPFLQRIDAGQGIDQQAYQEAAQAYLDIQRQLEASGPAFFATFDKIRDYTTRAIAKIDNATPLLPAKDPFAEATANATQSTAEILAQQTGQLAAIENYLAQIAGGDAAFNAFIGAQRNFA